MHNVLIVSGDDKLKNFIAQNQIGHNFISEHKNKIFQSLKTLIRKEFDIMIYNINSQNIDVLYVLEVAKKLNKDIHLIALNGNNDFLPLNSTNKTNIYYLQFKPSEFSQLKFYLDRKTKREVNNPQQN